MVVLDGREWTFIGGLGGCAIASAIGGLSQSSVMLVARTGAAGDVRRAARAVGPVAAHGHLRRLTGPAQGVRHLQRHRRRGASVGPLLGGALTQALSWRFCLYVNLVIAVPTALIAFRLIVNEEHPDRQPIDVPGVIHVADAAAPPVRGPPA